jgi:DNA gyrase subunit A
MGRASRGVRGIRLSVNDELAAMLRVDPSKTMLIATTNGYGKRVEYDNFSSHGRGTGGQMIYVPDDVSGEVVDAVSIDPEDEAMIITSTGKTIKIDAESVRILGKGARGVRIVNIGSPDLVIGLDRVVREEEAAIAAASGTSENPETADEAIEPNDAAKGENAVESAQDDAEPDQGTPLGDADAPDEAE